MEIKQKKLKKINLLTTNKMSKSYIMNYGSVNGPSCSYAKLKTYANCARAEIRPSVPVNVAAAATPAPVAVAAPPAPMPMEAAPMPMEAAPAPVAEGYLDPSPYSLPGGANTGATNYNPSYTVPNYAPINTNSLMSAEATCGGYRKILGAYGGMNGSSCTTNYINN